jgi:tetratricopeptide (TPR) repeat protein
MMVLLAASSLGAASVKEMDREAQAYFDKRNYNQAIGLWLTCLEQEPANENIQQKIEVVYQIKQQKDFSFQNARLKYRLSRRLLEAESDEEVRQGIEMGRQAISDYGDAYRVDPNDSEMRDAQDGMKNLEKEIRSALEKIRLSEALRKKIEDLKLQARTEMLRDYPDYPATLEMWMQVLKYVPRDSEALEGERKCKFAIENRIKFEKIRDYMTRGTALFNKEAYGQARAEFNEVLKIDPKNRDAKNYLEKISEITEEKMLLAQRQKQAEDSYRAARNNIAANHFDEAQQDLEACLSLVKNYKDAAELLKNLDRFRKDFEKKEQELRLRRINNAFQEGIMAYTLGNYKQAIDAFVLTLSLDRKNEHAEEYLRRARDALRLEEEESVDENSPYYSVINSIAMSGKSLYAKGQYVESRKKWDGILTLFPKNKVAREYIIKCDLMINPQNRDNVMAARVMEGRKYLDGKDFRNAVRIFNIIKTIDREYPGIDNLIAQATTGMKEAEAGTLTAAERDTNNRLYNEAMNLYQAGGKDNINRALAQLNRIVRSDPNNVKAAISVNKIESQLRIGGAEPEQKTALTDKQKALVNTYYYNGINYYTSNNFQKAVEEWRKVLAIDPGNIKARNNIRKVLAFMER